MGSKTTIFVVVLAGVACGLGIVFHDGVFETLKNFLPQAYTWITETITTIRADPINFFVKNLPSIAAVSSILAIVGGLMYKQFSNAKNKVQQVAVQQVNDTQIDAQNQIQGYKIMASDATKQATEYKTQYETVQQNLSEAQTQVTNLQNQVTFLQNENKQLTAECAALQKDVDVAKKLFGDKYEKLRKLGVVE